MLPPLMIMLRSAAVARAAGSPRPASLARLGPIVHRLASSSSQPSQPQAPAPAPAPAPAMDHGPTWSVPVTPASPESTSPQAQQQQEQHQQRQHYVAEDNPWSIPIYLLSAGLITGSLYYVNHQSNQKIDPTAHPPAATTGLDVFGVASSSSDDSAREARLFDLTVLAASTLWARVQNLFIYPSAVRTPLRSALVYHLVLPDPAKAEASYLTAWDAARALGALDLEAGIALQLARFYADQDAPMPALRWYHLGLERLLGWYADTDERNNHRKRALVWASREGQERLERVAGVLSFMARAKAYAASHPAAAAREAPGASARAVPEVTVDAYYSMALATMLLATRVSSVTDESRVRTAVDAHLGALLRLQVPQVGIPPPAAAAAATAESGTASQGTDQLVALLEDMATYYSAQDARAYAATLRRALLGYMPGSDARDVYCRRATVMNNLAEDLAAAAQVDAGKREEYLAGARVWLLRARDATEEKRAPECVECRAVVLNNLGQVAEMRGDLVRAAKYLKSAVAEARKAGMVDVRREAQVNLERVEAELEKGKASK